MFNENSEHTQGMGASWSVETKVHHFVRQNVRWGSWPESFRVLMPQGDLAARTSEDIFIGCPRNPNLTRPGELPAHLVSCVFDPHPDKMGSRSNKGVNVLNPPYKPQDEIAVHERCL